MLPTVAIADELNIDLNRFLWVTLQLKTICAQQTDSDIRKALCNLPKTLPETFSRILNGARYFAPTQQSRLLKLLVAALRPLTTDELQEAMSVTPFDTVWDASKLINNVHTVLATCSSLIVIDEEQETVQFIHPSVEQFLLGDFGHNSEFHFDQDEANLEMVQTMLTYLNYNVFGTQVSRAVVPSILAQQAPERILGSTFNPSGARSLAIHLLRSRKKPNFDVGKALAAHSPRFEMREQNTFIFHQYAHKNFLEHTKDLRNCSGALLSLFQVSLLRSSLLQTCLEASLPESWVYNQFPLRFSNEDMHEELLILQGRQCLPSNHVFRGEFVERVNMVYFCSVPLHWALDHSHFGAFRSQLRDKRAGLRNLSLFAIILKHPCYATHDILERLTPQFRLKIMCIAATFKAYEMCKTLVSQLSNQMSSDDILYETSKITENPLVLATIAKECKKKRPP